MNEERIRKKLKYWTDMYDSLMETYRKLIESGVQAYEIDDRAKTNFGIPNLRKALEGAEEKIAECEAELSGMKPRKIMAIVPRGW